MQEEGGELTATAWKLYDLAWQLIAALQRAAEGGVGLTGVEDPIQRAPQFPGVAGFALGAMPFGLDKHLASLPLLNRQEGRMLQAPYYNKERKNMSAINTLFRTFGIKCKLCITMSNNRVYPSINALAAPNARVNSHLPLLKMFASMHASQAYGNKTKLVSST